MKNKIIWFVLCSFIFSLMLVPARAEEVSSCSLAQAHIDENVLDIIARGDFDMDGAEVKVANRQSTITDGGYLSEGTVRVRTTILLDVSTSMPYATREKVIDFIEAEIKELSGYEELRLVTFGDSVDVIQDFTSDRYELSEAAKGIEFTGQASAIYDAINSTISSPAASDGSPCFYRTIVITDGVDSTAGGITKEELYMRLIAETYPIDVIEVSKNKLTDPDKDLAALSRISNGTYSELNSGTDVSECAFDVSLSDFFWLRAEVPANLLDGSTRQVDISDGNNSFSFDMKMSVVDAPFEEPVSIPAVETPPVSSKPRESVPTSTASASGSDKSGSVNVVLIIAIGGCVMIAAVLVAVLPAAKRKKNRNKHIEPPAAPNNNEDNNTGNKTEVLLEDSPRNSYTVKLSLSGDSSRSWTIDVEKDVVIGRADSCDLKFDDNSISREQFKLVAGETGVMLSNLSSSNVTKVNNAAATEDVALQLGDIIKIGRVSLSVDLIQKITDDDSSSGSRPENDSGEKTMTVF